MSDKSAKLLLEVARTIEQDQERNPGKWGRRQDLSISVSLMSEITTWARGYRIHIDRKCREKKNTIKPPSYDELAADNAKLQDALNLLEAECAARHGGTHDG
jgi:hypothetical protein